MANATAKRTAKLVRMRVTKISLVDRPATGETALLYKGDGAAAAVVKAEDVPELAEWLHKDEVAAGTRRFTHDFASVLRLLESIGR